MFRSNRGARAMSRPTLLAVVASLAATAVAVQPDDASAQAKTEQLPSVVVETAKPLPAPGPKPVAKIATPDAADSPKAKPTASKPKSAQGTTSPEAPPAGGANASAGEAAASTGASALNPAPGTRTGSLTVPTVAEARADIQTTPGGVDLVAAEEYRGSTPAVTIKDALDYVPGVFVQPKWGEDSRLSIRGSGLSRNFHGRGVTLLMDGIIPISTADGASDFQEIDPTAYRYIEVYKGGNALRFGANSLGGAINFVIPTGYDASLFGARVDLGSFGFRKLAASSGGVAGAADYFITGTWQEQDGFRDHSEGNSVRGAFNVGYRLNENVETRFYLNANRVRQKIPGALTRNEALNSPDIAAPANLALDYERNLDTVRGANKTTIRLLPGTYVEVGGFYFDRHLDHPIFQVIDNDHQEYGGFARLVTEQTLAGFRNRLTAGASIHNGDVRARQFISIAGERGALSADSTQTSDNTVLYAENAFYVTPAFALIAGVSWSDISRQLDDRFLSNGDQSRGGDYTSTNPRGGFLWELAPTVQVFGNVTKSTEVPTFSEITIAGVNVVSLAPQEALTYEFGTRGRLPGFVWDATVYRANLDNEFQCLAVSGAGTCTQVNIEKSIHQGVELGASARILSGVFEGVGRQDEVWLNAAYTFSDFRFDGDAVFGDNQLPGAPRHFLRAELLYKHPSGVYFGPNVEWVPEAYYVDSANTTKTAAYALLGAKIGFDNGGPWTAYLEGRNLTDETYISSVSIANTANAASRLYEPGNGRAVYGGVQWKW
ncbi:MAG: TonB-dependent receptor [Ralstonia sp.]|uniref:TonB-dependent receptor family protein n=1 Tax=Ralstonia sp. TaxID=54061 RepID=UPI002579C8B6|nr:TonB-dependent receptor [Ralstonia sp.]MBA4234020.1 TonB-dependent receptor [Ralstonia sp.]